MEYISSLYYGKPFDNLGILMLFNHVLSFGFLNCFDFSVNGESSVDERHVWRTKFQSGINYCLHSVNRK